MPTINKRRIDTIMSLKKKIAAAFIACAMTLAVVPSAFACTALYVGSDLTEAIPSSHRAWNRVRLRSSRNFQ